MGRLSGGFGGLTAQSRQRTQPERYKSFMGSFWDRWSEWRSARQRPQLPNRWGSRFGMPGGLGGYGINKYAGSQARQPVTQPLPKYSESYHQQQPTPTMWAGGANGFESLSEGAQPIIIWCSYG
jgi:hypothetical protein